MLRLANATRLPLFKNSKGELAHNTTGSDWSLLEWGGAMAGEAGELCNLLKKVRRGDLDINDKAVREEIGKEIADVQIYLDLIAMRCGLSLAHATVAKFNEVSRRVGVGVFITCDDPVESQYGSVMVEKPTVCEDEGCPHYGTPHEDIDRDNSCDADNMVSRR